MQEMYGLLWWTSPLFPRGSGKNISWHKKNSQTYNEAAIVFGCPLCNEPEDFNFAACLKLFRDFRFVYWTIRFLISLLLKGKIFFIVATLHISSYPPFPRFFSLKGIYRFMFPLRTEGFWRSAAVLLTTTLSFSVELLRSYWHFLTVLPKFVSYD